jgi:heat-inducible transcriptional repressor
MLDERSKRVLCAVIQNYISHPDPVGSRTVAKKYSFGLSAATIRNIMADLEEIGFLTHPHTSAGRVPTDKGYRFYVDSLSTTGDSSNKEVVRGLFKKLDALRENLDMLFSEATKTISLLSHYLGVAMSPDPDVTTLKRIELFNHRTNQVAAIIFTDEGLVKNKIIDMDFNVTQKDLHRISGYLNSEFSGYTFDEIRKRILTEMSREKLLCDRLISKAIDICREAFFSSYGDLFIAGLSEVLELPDFSDLQKIRDLSKAVEDKHMIIKLLGKLSESDGVQIIIGSENSMNEMKKLSLVVSACKEDDRPIGVIGIIGPTRMNYFKAISIVDMTAKFISRMLVEK